MNPGRMEAAPGGPGRSSVLLRTLPRDHLTDHLWHVFFVREVGAAPGVYVPNVPAVIQSEVDPWGRAGLEGELVRVLAHELGHSLGLAHVPCIREGNLMSAGCDSENRTRLTDIQIDVARDQAASARPFAGNSSPQGPVAFLLAHDREMGFSPEQRRTLEQVADDLASALTPLREAGRELNREGMRQMRSGSPDPAAARARQARMQEIAREMRYAEEQALDRALSSFGAEQRERAQRLLERRAVMMGGGS